MSARYRDRRQPTSIRLDDKLKALLRAEAQRQRRSLSEMIDFILHEYVSRIVIRKTRKPREKKIEDTQ